jgi:hypothetical protein
VDIGVEEPAYVIEPDVAPAPVEFPSHPDRDYPDPAREAPPEREPVPA